MQRQPSLRALLLSTALVLGACSADSTFPVVENAGDGLPSVACRYRMEKRAVTRDGEGGFGRPVMREFVFLREPDRIEQQPLGPSPALVWKRDSAGQVFYFEIGRGRNPVEYTPGDLKAQGRYPRWKQLSSFVEENFLSNRLERTGSDNALGHSGLRYRGIVDGSSFEVLWLPQAGVPALLRETRSGIETKLILEEIYPFAASPWARTQWDPRSTVDFADLGDLHGDHQHDSR